VLMLWHAFMFIGLRFFLLFYSFYSVVSADFPCKNISGTMIIGVQLDTCQIIPTLLPIWLLKSEIPVSSTGYGYYKKVSYHPVSSRIV
jgi:hypothetical protein